MTNIKPKLMLAIGLAFAACAVVACKKTPAIPQASDKDIALNFFAVSDVMRSAYAKTGKIAIFIDHYQEHIEPQSQLEALTSRFPVINFTYPTPEYPANLTNGVPNFARYVAGTHQMIFTDTTNTIVAQTGINPELGSFTTVYLADDNAQSDGQAAYAIVAVQEDRSPVDNDKIGVRFIHLSPDAGPLTCNLLKPDGSTLSLFSGPLQFKEASAYQYFDASTANAGIVHFILNNSSNHAEVITGAAFRPGRRYAIVISGFLTQQQRQMAGKNPDGSLFYKPITIPQNLKAELRAIY